MEDPCKQTTLSTLTFSKGRALISKEEVDAIRTTVVFYHSIIAELKVNLFAILSLSFPRCARRYGGMFLFPAEECKQYNRYGTLRECGKRRMLVVSRRVSHVCKPSIVTPIANTSIGRSIRKSANVIGH